MGEFAIVVDRRRDPQPALDRVDHVLGRPELHALDWRSGPVAIRWRWDPTCEDEPIHVEAPGIEAWLCGFIVNADAVDLAGIVDRLAAGDPGPAGALRGQWLLAVWHEPSATLRVVCDQLGSHTFAWARTPGGCVAASEVGACVAHPDVSAEVNEATLAIQLSGALEETGTTLFRDVHSVSASRMLTITGGTGRVDRWFTPRSRLADIATFDEAGTIVRDAMMQAIPRWCPTGPFGLALSGGLDSSTLAGVAAATGRADDMTALTLRYPGTAADEEQYQDAVIDQFGLRQLSQGQVTGFDYLAQLQEEAERGLTPAKWIEAELVALLRRAHDAGVTSVIQGVGGDELFAPSRPTGLDLVASPSFWSAAARGGAAGRVDWSPRRALRDLLTRALLDRVRPPGTGVVPAEAARRLDLAERTREPARRPGFAGALTLVRWALYDSSYLAGVATMRDRADAAARVRQLSPFQDVDLVETCLAIPPLWFADRSDPRSLQRLAAGDLLAEAVRNRRSKVYFDTIIAAHLVRPATEALLDDLELERRGLVDGQLVRARYREVRAAIERPSARSAPGIVPLAGVIGHEIWLRSVGAQPHCVE